MDTKKSLHDKMLIEQTITGQATDEQFNEVMDRAETDPAFRHLYQQTVAEQNWLEQEVSEAQHVFEQRHEVDQTVEQVEEMNRESDFSHEPEALEEEFEKLMEQRLEEDLEI